METTWKCDQCGNSNQLDSWPCEECRYPLVRDNSRKKPAPARGHSSGSTFSLKHSRKHWECLHCKTMNPITATRCNTCLTHWQTETLDKKRADNTGKRLQLSMEGIYNLLDSSADAEELIGEIPRRTDREWLKKSADTGIISSDENINSTNIKVRDLVGEHPRACDVGGAIVLHHGLEKRTVAGVLFRVYAPNAQKVAVVGEWNGWKPWQDYLVKEGEYWQTIVPTARPGHNYNYIVQYYDKHAKKTVSKYKADPRGEILHFTKGRWRNEIYDHKAFKWTDDMHVPKKPNEMILYELHVGSFPASGCCRQAYDNENVEFPEKIGTFNDITENLGYFIDLGINTLALLPVTQDAHMKPYNCWGYDPISLWAVHTDYGTPDDLKHLINSAHLAGISVLLDYVPNHLAAENILNYFDGPNDIYFPDDVHIRNTDWGPRLDYASSKVRGYVVDGAESWLRDFHFDGIRVDSTCNIRAYSLHGDPQIHPDGWILLQELTDMIRLKFPNCISIAEDLQDHESRLNHGGAGFDSQWDDVFFSAVLQAVVTVSDTQRNMKNLAKAICMASLPGCSAGGRVIFTESHDTVPSDRQGRIPAAILRGNQMDWPDCNDIENNFFSLKRTALALAILMTSPGIPMLLQGQEALETCAPTWPFGPMFDRTRSDRMDPPYGFEMLLKDLCSLRANQKNLTQGLSGNYARANHLNDYGDNRVLAIHRWTHGGPTDDTIVIINCGNIYYEEYWLGFPRYGSWKLRFNSDDTKYCSSFTGSEAIDTVETVKESKDGYPYSGAVAIGPYTVLIYSQDATSTVKFSLKCQLKRNTKLYVVGDIPELGDWDPLQALEAERRGNSTYQTAEVCVAPNQMVEFKFVIIEGLEKIYWQSGKNNSFLADKGNRNYLIDCENIKFQGPHEDPLP